MAVYREYDLRPCELVERMGRLVSWLNENAGAVMAIATVVLAALTAWYVRFTRAMSLAAREQLRLALEARREEKRDRVLALHALTNRLGLIVGHLSLAESQLPTMKVLPLWTAEDLRELEQLAEGSSDELRSRVVFAVHNLGAMTKRAERLAEAASRGWGMGDSPWGEWQDTVKKAMGDLIEIMRIAKAEAYGSQQTKATISSQVQGIEREADG